MTTGSRLTARQFWARRRAVRRWPPPGPTGDDRFGLRLLAVDDRDRYLAAIDHEVRHYQGYDADVIAGLRATFNLMERKPGVIGHMQELVVVWQGQFGGSYTIRPSMEPRADVEVGWWLAPQARTKGLGQASLAAVLEHVHHGIGLPVARMGTTHDNLRAIRQIEAVGAVRVGETDHLLPNGRTVRGFWFHHTAD